MNNSNSNFPKRYFGSAKTEEPASSNDKITGYRLKNQVRFIESLPPNATVLDIGCGKGKNIRLINRLRKDIKVIGTDLTDVSEFLPKNDMVTFFQVTSDDLLDHCKPNSVDAVMSEHVIEHIVYPNKMFENIYQVLKSGGKVFIETPNWTRLVLPFSPLYFWNDYTHIHPYCITALRRAFIEYGFEEEYVRSVSSIEFGKRFLHTRIQDGQIKTGRKTAGVYYKSKDSFFRKVFNAVLDLTIHPFARDILIGVAKKP